MSKKNENRNKALIQIAESYNTKILIFVMIFIAFIIVSLSTAIISQTKNAMNRQVEALIDADCEQLQLNIDSYLEKVEKTATLLFADGAYYKYDATDESIDEYDRIQCEKVISNRITDLGIIDNFSDFAVVYANDHTVGWLSKTTQGLYPSGEMFSSFSEKITNDKTKDGWCFAGEGRNGRMYYLKSLNKNALLLISFYNNELNSVFEYPDEIQGLTIRLIDDDSQVLYSSSKTEIGSQIGDDVESEISGKRVYKSENATYFINMGECTNGWRVLCTVEKSAILTEFNTIAKDVIFSIAIILVIMLIFVYALGRYLTRMTNDLDVVYNKVTDKATYDELSGVLNKASMEEVATTQIKYASKYSTMCFIMMDVDNFKSINDTLGHAYGDEVIKRMGAMLKSTWGAVIDSNICIGRMGGDEFAICTEISEVIDDNLKKMIGLKTKVVMQAFDEEFKKEREKLNISLSCGICLVPASEADYEVMYRQADSALYSSKHSGKNCFTIYEGGTENA